MIISTSILNANNKIETIKKLNKTDTGLIHLDIMDGKFVPNKALCDTNEINKIIKEINKKIDIHLMVENEEQYINQICVKNIEYITFHIETKSKIDNLIKNIKEKGIKVGISIKPKTNPKLIKKYINDIDLILIMSVEPGLGGQKFINNTKYKVKKIRKLIKNKNIKIEVDGGINNKTIKKIKQADIAVSGSYIITKENYNNQINNLIKSSQTNIMDKIKNMINS